jgi:hypothetical protein
MFGLQYELLIVPIPNHAAPAAAVGAVYFVQGILGLSRLALSFFFKDDLGVEPAQVCAAQHVHVTLM